MKVLVLDNYDSFTYNLVHYLQELHSGQVVVRRNDEISLQEVAAFDKILLSPGPGLPNEAGIMNQLIARYAPDKSIMGVCLGMQAIGQVFHSQLLNLPDVYHGIATTISVLQPDELLFRSLPDTLTVGRYHSWIVEAESLSEELEMTARAETGELMALRHKTYDVRGVQFHPESVLTPEGLQMIDNWLKG